MAANLPDGTELVSIPLGNTSPWFNFSIILSNIQFVFYLRFNTRMSQWILDINNPHVVPILSGIPLLTNRNLITRFSGQTGVPPGTLFVTDDTGAGLDPSRYSFGVSHTLWYLDPLAVT